jgi:hypothetical protein
MVVAFVVLNDAMIIPLEREDGNIAHVYEE